MNINIAIIGLGRVGSILLQELLKNREKGISIIAAGELADTPGRRMARENKIDIMSIEDIVALGKKIDIIFELTGELNVTRQLRTLLQLSNNSYTVIATETIATMIFLLMSVKNLPDVHDHKGY
jgi:predicted dinucleotide-utilizing enzyme